jgi:hypothetical protein
MNCKALAQKIFLEKWLFISFLVTEYLNRKNKYSQKKGGVGNITTSLVKTDQKPKKPMC